MQIFFVLETFFTFIAQLQCHIWRQTRLDETTKTTVTTTRSDKKGQTLSNVEQKNAEIKNVGQKRPNVVKCQTSKRQK